MPNTMNVGKLILLSNYHHHYYLQIILYLVTHRNLDRACYSLQLETRILLYKKYNINTLSLGT